MSHARKTILLVEDDSILLEITSFRLELLGYEVVTRDTVAGALAWMATNLPDLIVVGFPADMDPIEFLNRISDDQRTSQTPLLHLSGNSDLDEVQRAYNAGADEYLLTPYDPLMLERKVEDLLSAETFAPAR